MRTIHCTTCKLKFKQKKRPLTVSIKGRGAVDVQPCPRCGAYMDFKK